MQRSKGLCLKFGVHQTNKFQLQNPYPVKFSSPLKMEKKPASLDLTGYSNLWLNLTAPSACKFK